jgi:ATP-dependent helicase HrpB
VTLDPLPIDGAIPTIVEALRRCRAVVVTGAPGSGKTTRVPPALTGDGPVLLLQPRRVAARSIAHRIAQERGWRLGSDVGWHIRFDRREDARTRLLVATEGILTARLQRDPLLSDFRTVVIDEFHERSIHSDLGLALARQAWLARDDFRIVVMSATIDASLVSPFLGGCPIVDVPGRLFPVEVDYQAGRDVVDAAAAAAATTIGAVLVFLPGAREIADTRRRLQPRLPQDVSMFDLYGSLDAARQDEVLTSTGQRRVILATNIAETTLTVPDVRVVVDAGWQRLTRYDAERAIDRLVTERVTRDAADQRAGRAGRVAAGRVIRLWDERVRLRPHREPEIHRIDLAGPLLDVLAWGGSPTTFEWLEAPRADAVSSALTLLKRLGALDRDGRLSEDGRRMRGLSLHPRLARLLLETGAEPIALRAAALLADRHEWPGAAETTACDLWAAAERPVPPQTLRAVRQLQQQLERVGLAETSPADETRFRRAILTAYPDRVGRRREPQGDRLLLATGTGARLASGSGVRAHEFVVALDITMSDREGEALLRAATGIEREWLTPTGAELVHTFDDSSGTVRARRVLRYDALELSVQEVQPDPDETRRLLVAAALARGPTPDDEQWLARLRLAGCASDYSVLVSRAARTAQALSDLRLERGLDAPVRQVVEREAPVRWRAPSGRDIRLDYRGDGRVIAGVKLQELFGLADTPCLGPGRTPITFELLAPNGRPVQVTSDLRSFWAGTYLVVRKELRARYPKHPWPADPWSARPTHRTLRRQ